MDRLKSAFRETPWTVAIACLSVAIWVISFFGLTAPLELLGGQPDLAHAWRWLTYPLANPVAPRDFIWLALGAWVFTLFAGPLERMWGSLRFGRIFVLLTLAGALLEWLAYAAASGVFPPAAAQLWSLRLPAAAIFTIWAALHQEFTVLAMFVIPIKARYLALIGGALMLFDGRGAIFGLASVFLMGASWLWALRYGSAFGGTAGSGFSNPATWLKKRQREQRKSRFQVLEGGTVASSPLRSVPPSLEPVKPVSKLDSGAEKELDRILDKIRFEGMNSLSQEERRTLDNQSRRLREEP